jgi:cobalt-precorrin 5A hydrolase/precorrin-3B C17-methyltransferase
MNMTKPAIVSLSTSSIDLAKRIALKTGGQVHGFQKRIIDADVLFENVAEHLTALFASKTPIIAIMASGAVIRILAPQLINKMDEAAVISVS